MTQGIISASNKIVEAVKAWSRDVKNAEVKSFD
jgi:hypothetical protein